MTETDDDDLTPEFLKNAPEPTWRTYLLTMVCLSVLVAMIFAVCYMLAGFGQVLRQSYPLPVVAVDDAKDKVNGKDAQKKDDANKKTQPAKTENKDAKPAPASSSGTTAKPSTGSEQQKTTPAESKPASRAGDADRSPADWSDIVAGGVVS